MRGSKRIGKVYKFAENRYVCGSSLTRCGLVYALFLAIVLVARSAC